MNHLSELSPEKPVFAAEIGSVFAAKSKRYSTAPMIDLMLARCALQSESLSIEERLVRGSSLFFQAFDALSGDWPESIQRRANELRDALKSDELSLAENDIPLRAILYSLCDLVDECCATEMDGDKAVC